MPPDDRPLAEVEKDFWIEAAHLLPNVPEGHKCRRLHGHSFQVTVVVRGPVLEPEGWVIDFQHIKSACAPIFEQLDHHYLNDVDGLSNPTTENLARWVWERLRPVLPLLTEIRIAETCTSKVVYRGTAG